MSHPPPESWDLPSDADMLRWVEAKGVTVRKLPDWAPRDAGHWSVFRDIAGGIEVFAVAPTIHAALEQAMKENP